MKKIFYSRNPFKWMVLGLASFLPIGCLSTECVLHPLNEKSLDWFKPYKTGDEIILTSNLGNTDIIQIKKNKTNTNADCNWLELGVKQHEIARIYLSSIYTDKFENAHQNESELEVFEKTTNKNPNNLLLRLYTLTYGIFDKDDKLVYEPIIETISIGSEQIEVYKVENGVNGRSSWGNLIQKFYWSKSQGLMRYVTTSNETFTIKH